jgi:hypothetical protein
LKAVVAADEALLKLARYESGTRRNVPRPE